jgi:hypothetical protein
MLKSVKHTKKISEWFCEKHPKEFILFSSLKIRLRCYPSKLCLKCLEEKRLRANRKVTDELKKREP